LERPWYKRMYDVPAIIGQAICIPELQIPELDICSDYGDLLKVGEPDYDLKHPDPEDVNRWLVAHPDRCEVYGRYVPD
jgi:hypothetical protein